MRSIEILPGVRVTSDRCLVMDEGPTVVMGDLHLGYERALENEGVYLPRINTDSIRESLNDILCRYEPQRVV
ncbi:MAG: phosphoesterase, partial [Candidatus Methanomethylophilaceae archaeon]|nr:phosphoesterase [Candidatus Methanomethylophilaceae archaeon]